MKKLSAPNALRKHILEYCLNFDDKLKLPEFSNEEEINDFFYDPSDDFRDILYDAKSEVRCSGIETNIPSDNFSRHYESEEVAAKMSDGTWVGWTYWHGGGKHGEPAAIDWMGEAYYLSCEEKEVLTIQRTWAKL